MGWEDVGVQIALKLLPLIVTLLTALIGLGLAYVKKKMDFIKNESLRKSINDAITEAEKVAKDAVNNTQQTFVADIKEARKDGKLTEEEAKEALEKAKQYFVNNISDDSMSIIEAGISPVIEYAEQLIEAKIGEMKDNSIQSEVAKLANPKSVD